MKKLATKKDIILILLVLVVCAVGFFLINSGDTGTDATIKVDGEVVATISLNSDGEYSFEGVTVSVENGEILVKSSTCSDKVCVNSGKISKSGEGIICAPNRFSIEINGKGNLPDAMTG